MFLICSSVSIPKRILSVPRCYFHQRPQLCSPFWPFWTQQKSFRAHAAQKGTAGKLRSNGEQNRAVSSVSEAGKDQTRTPNHDRVACIFICQPAFDYGSRGCWGKTCVVVPDVRLKMASCTLIDQESIPRVSSCVLITIAFCSLLDCDFCILIVFNQGNCQNINDFISHHFCQYQ